MTARVFVLRDDPIRRRLIDFLSGLAIDSKALWEVEIRPFKKQRTQPQNRYYWQMLQEVAEQLWVDGRQYDKDTLHEYFKGEFLGWNEKVLPSGELYRTPISTSKLPTKEFAEYVTRIEAWAAHHGVFFEASTDYLNSMRQYARAA